MNTNPTYVVEIELNGRDVLASDMLLVDKTINASLEGDVLFMVSSRTPSTLRLKGVWREEPDKGSFDMDVPVHIPRTYTVFRSIPQSVQPPDGFICTYPSIFVAMNDLQERYNK